MEFEIFIKPCGFAFFAGFCFGSCFRKDDYSFTMFIPGVFALFGMIMEIMK